MEKKNIYMGSLEMVYIEPAANQDFCLSPFKSTSMTKLTEN